MHHVLVPFSEVLSTIGVTVISTGSLRDPNGLCSVFRVTDIVTERMYFRLDPILWSETTYTMIQKTTMWYLTH